MHTWEIVGIVFGAIVFAALVWHFWWKPRQVGYREKPDHDEMDHSKSNLDL